MAARAGRNDVDRVRTAIIGAGAMGRQHAQWLAPMPEAQVVAIVLPHIPSAHKLAASLRLSPLMTEGTLPGARAQGSEVTRS